MKQNINFKFFVVHKLTPTLFGGKSVLAAMLFLLSFAVTQTAAATFTVSNTNDSGPGSLRQAILDANGNSGADQINVSVANGTINLLTPLPAITETVSIINLDTGSGRVELNGLATRDQAQPSIGFDIQALNCEIRGFAINRFGDAGIRVGIGGDGTTIHQNYIGTNKTGDSINCPDATNPCGNLNRGVWVYGATNVHIGTSGAGGLPNTISGNLGRGITISGASLNNTFYNASAIVQNNFIGSGSGNDDLGNTLDGILIAGGSGSQIGGSAPVSNDANIIIGNGGNGINIVADFDFPASNNNIQGNNIGYTLGTNVALGNDGSGIVIQGANNTIGGTTADARNVITGNSVNGISIYSNFATGNVVQGNYIGVGLSNNAAGNGANGIQISNSASGNTVGGATGLTVGSCTGVCNVIANNGNTTAQTARSGVYVDATGSNGNAIEGNSIYANGGIGIDLGAPGTAANDANDPDMGANDLQNFPVISSAQDNGVIAGTLNSTPNTTFRIDFYSNPATDGNGSEGRTFIGFTNVTTDGSGNATISYNSMATLAAGQFITATATTVSGSAQAVGDTSEFSAPTVLTVAGTFSISGTITYGNTPSGDPVKPVPNATVNAYNSTRPDETATTDASGYYQINNLAPLANYTVTPSKSGGINGGITPFDAVLILRCTAAASCGLTSTQRTAADTNGSGNITPFDATLILRYAAANGPNANTGQVGNWMFEPPQRDYTMTSSQTNQDYTAFLIGDVNGSWMPQPPPPAPAPAFKTNRKQLSEMQLSIPTNLAAAQGGTILVPVNISNRSGRQISGYALDVTFDPKVLQLDEAQPVEISDTLTAKGFTVSTGTKAAASGRVSVAAASATALTNAEETTLLRLRFRVVGKASRSAANSISLAVSRNLFEDNGGEAIAAQSSNGRFTVAARRNESER